MRSEVRHQLKRDKFAATATGTVAWAMEHRINLIGGAIVAAIIIALVLGGWYYTQHKEDLASAQLSSAIQTLEAPLRPATTPADPNLESYTSSVERAQAAEKKFQAVADQYKHTDSSKMARYFMGVTEMQAGSNSAAEKQLKDVVAMNNDELSPLAKLALASLYKSTNRDPQAIAFYKELIDHPTRAVPKTAAQFEMAKFYQDKQPQEAMKIYQQIQKEDPTGAAGEIAQAKMAGLRQ